MPGGGGVVVTIYGQHVAGLTFQFTAHANLAAPQFVCHFGECAHRGDFLGLVCGGEFLLPLFDRGKIVRLDVLNDLVVVGTHAGVAGQELVDTPGVGRALVETDIFRRFLIPTTVLGFFPQLGFQIATAASANQRIATDELRTEPRYERAFANGVEPERHFSKFDGDGVEVDAVDVAVGNEHFDALQFGLTPFCGNGSARAFRFNALVLAHFQVHAGKLVDGFIQECGRPHGGFADFELQNIRGMLNARSQFLERIFDQALGEAVRRVERGAGFAFASRQSVDEGPRLISA